MNQNILKKAIEELQKEQFRKDYVLGMLETLYEMGEQPKESYGKGYLDGRKTAIGDVLSVMPMESKIIDEGNILDAKALAAIKQVKAMSEASTE